MYQDWHWYVDKNNSDLFHFNVNCSKKTFMLNTASASKYGLYFFKNLYKPIDLSVSSRFNCLEKIVIPFSWSLLRVVYSDRDTPSAKQLCRC